MIALATAVTPAVHQSALVLADLVQTPGTGGKGEGFGKALPIALIVLIVFFIAVGFLIRSMTRHLKKVPLSFDPQERSKLEAEARAADEAARRSGVAPAKPMNSVRAKAYARAAERAKQVDAPQPDQGAEPESGSDRGPAHS